MRGERVIGIVLRAAHTGTMAVLVGGLFAGVGSSLHLWQILTALTGVALLVSEASHSRHWIYQGRGLVTLCHVGILALVVASADLARYGLAAALVIGSVGSHLPRTLRKWSFRHQRIVD